jgi:hypothetical protein
MTESTNYRYVSSIREYFRVSQKLKLETRCSKLTQYFLEPHVLA